MVIRIPHVLQLMAKFDMIIMCIFMQHSWKWFIYYRCQNVNRQSKQDGGNPQKRAKLDSRAVHVCPLTLAEDEVSFVQYGATES